MHSVVLVPVLHVAVDCQRRGLAQCLAAVSVLQLVVVVHQLAVWTGAAELLPSAATGFAGLAIAAVSGFAERPVSAVASGWHCQRCLPGEWSVRRNQLTDVTLSCGVMTWN